MITIKAGSQVYNIITVLAVAGEFPMYSVQLIGSPRTYKRKIVELTAVQSFRNPYTGETLRTKLLNISGRGSEKTIRFYKGALPILEWVGLADCYRNTFYNHALPGNKSHKDRNHRIAEALAMCMRAGIAFRPDRIPSLQDGQRFRLFETGAAFYTSRQLKSLSVGEMDKIKFTRLVGAVVAYNTCYAVYNARDAVMKWNGRGELKTRFALTEISRMNVGEDSVEAAILFGETEDKALKTVLASEEKGGKDFRLDIVYQNVHFIPMNENGMRILRFFLVPNWKTKLRALLFDEAERMDGFARIDCDAYVDGAYVFSYLDGDMARLIRFRDATHGGAEKYEILCFPFQASFVKKYFGKDARVKTIELELIEQALGIKEVE